MPTGNTPRGSASGGDACPVDQKTRDAWLEQARAHTQAQKNGPQPMADERIVQQDAPKSGLFSGWPSLWASSEPPVRQPSPLTASTRLHPHHDSQAALGTDRVISSIPRTSADRSDGTNTTSLPPACPVNHEVETGADPVSGNWIYPSEKMFFDAMKRKGNDNARIADMKVVVPIHNAVNERAWKEILEWEAPYTRMGPSQCGGPRLHSFAGLSTSMSPRARLNTLLGYSAPFDRHDWIVDRCGTRVEYIIDFYAGRPGKATDSSQPQVSFYLDVRPKLNSWEGVKMRALRALHLQ